jgi:hypothetical protein
MGVDRSTCSGVVRRRRWTRCPFRMLPELSAHTLLAGDRVRKLARERDTPSDKGSRDGGRNPPAAT